MAKLSREAILQGAIEADSQRPRHFISCTAIRALDVVEKIENVIESRL